MSALASGEEGDEGEDLNMVLSGADLNRVTQQGEGTVRWTPPGLERGENRERERERERERDGEDRTWFDA